MMRIVGEIAIAIGSSLTLSVIVKATVISGSALIAAHITRRSRASLRHLLFATAFVVLLALPVVAVVVPAHEVNVAIPEPTPTAAVALAPLSTATSVGQSAAGGDLLLGVHPTRAWPSTSTLLTVGWLVGVAIFITPMAAGLWRVRRVRQNGLPWREGQVVLAEIAAAQALRRRIQLLLDEAVAGPMTCGVIRPAIVLPRAAHRWHPEDLRRAMVHELEHIRRADWLILCIARIACACYWFHPLVWMSWRRLRLEAERACDDAVLRSADPEAYADQLVTLAERLASNRTQSALAMANRGDLSARVSAVLDGRQPRGRAGSLWIATASLAAVLLVVAIAPLRAVAVPQGLTPADGARRTFEVASVKPNTSGAQALGARVMPGGRFVATNMPLRQLIRYAYDLQESELIGGTREPLSQRFDINAKAADDASVRDVRLMLQSLLEERFRLQAHREKRILPVFLLERTRQGGRSEPYLRPTAAMCDGPSLAEIGAGNADPTRQCGYFGPAPGADLASGRSRMALRGLTMVHFARLLAGSVRRPVIDRTGLAGFFDGEFDFSVELGPPPPPPGTLDPLDRSSMPSLFTVLPEQLGLRLEPANQPVEVLVIDSVDQPAADGDSATTEAVQGASAAQFEVASVRVNKSAVVGGFRGAKGRSYVATNQPLRNLVADAYGIPAARVVGGPAWIGTASADARFVGGDRFDITATLPQGATAQQVPRMLRALLAQRFKLVARTQTREAPIYELIIARDDGRLGPQLRKAPVDCEAAVAAGEVIPAPTPGEPVRCAREVGGTIIGRGQRLDALARMLSMFADRPVVDKTGLAGGFDFDVRFPELGTPVGGRGAAVGGNAGGIFVAVLEQLGLKLQPARGPLEFVVIDSVDHPTEN